MGLVSTFRTAVNADYEDGLFQTPDVFDDDPLWTDDDHAAVVQHLLLNPPSRLDACGLDVRGAVDALVDLEEHRSRIAAEQYRVMVALAGGTPRARQVTVWDEDDAPRSVELTDEAIEVMSTALRRSPHTVSRQLATARMLARLPRTSEALESGALTAEHAEQIARNAHDLPSDRLGDYEKAVLSRVLKPGSAMTTGEVAAFARRVRARLDAAGEEARRLAARRHEDVRIWAEGDGLACLMARLPMADAARVHAAIDARAREVLFDPDHSMGMRRAAALVDAICGGGDAPPASTGVAIQVTVDLATLLGVADEPALVTMPTGSPEPMTSGALRALLADPDVPVTLRRLVCDPVSGQVCDRGRTSYRVPDALRAFLIARDATCRFPGCSRRAEVCDIDHLRSWAEGGGTDAENTVPLCRRHHLLKTHGRWAIIARRRDGTVEWRAPDGRVIVTQPWVPLEPPTPPDPPTPQDEDTVPF